MLTGVVALLLCSAVVGKAQSDRDNRSEEYDMLSDPYDQQEEAMLEESSDEQQAYRQEYDAFIEAWEAGDVTVDAVEESDSLALVALYEETNGDN